jgi:hypothetical protein
VNSHELRAGDTIHLYDGTSARVSRIEQRYEPLLPVSNLTVRGFHTFFVGEESILVHNTSWCELEKRAKDLLGPGVSTLEIRIKMAHLTRTDNTNWTELITKRGDGKDALGRTKAQVVEMGMPDPIHGHHVKFKQAVTEQDILVQDTLLAYGIDPMYGKEMLVFAPNKGHKQEINVLVGEKVLNTVADKKRFQWSNEKTKQELIKALQGEAENYIEAKWPGYLTNFSIFK